MNVNLGWFPMFLELGFAWKKCLESTNGKTTPEHQKNRSISLCLPLLVQQGFADVANDCEMSYT